MASIFPGNKFLELCLVIWPNDPIPKSYNDLLSRYGKRKKNVVKYYCLILKVECRQMLSKYGIYNR